MFHARERESVAVQSPRPSMLLPTPAGRMSPLRTAAQDWVGRRPETQTWPGAQMTQIYPRLGSAALTHEEKSKDEEKHGEEPDEPEGEHSAARAHVQHFLHLTDLLLLAAHAPEGFLGSAVNRSQESTMTHIPNTQSCLDYPPPRAFHYSKHSILLLDGAAQSFGAALCHRGRGSVLLSWPLSIVAWHLRPRVAVEIPAGPGRHLGD